MLMVCSQDMRQVIGASPTLFSRAASSASWYGVPQIRLTSLEEEDANEHAHYDVNPPKTRDS